MVSDHVVAAVVVYLAIKYGIIISPGGRPRAAQIAVTLPSLLSAVLLIFTSPDSYYALTALVATALPVGLPRSVSPIVGVLASTILATRVIQAGNIVLGAAVITCSAIVGVFILVIG